MSPEGKLRLSHIVEAADRIAEYLQGISKESSLKDILRQDAVIRRIQIIGEAVCICLRRSSLQCPSFLPKKPEVCATSWSAITRK